MSALGFTLSGTLDAQFDDGVFTINVPQNNPLTLSFFGLGQTTVYGYLSSNGQFSLTGSIGFDLSDNSGDSIYGNLSITISNQGFSASGSGGATVLGTNVASVSGTVDIEGTGVYLAASLSVLGIPFNFNIQFGTISSQHPANQIYWYRRHRRAWKGDRFSLMPLRVIQRQPGIELYMDDHRPLWI